MKKNGANHRRGSTKKLQQQWAGFAGSSLPHGESTNSETKKNEKKKTAKAPQSECQLWT